MNRIKYQIFISSTYEDLKAERDQVIKACLEMGHIPVGMEMFSAADEEQWQIIARQIEESDYYVIIVANRYGSMVDGISYTEKEYDYAIEKGVPVLGFVLKDGAMWPSNLSELDAEGRLKLDAFKRKVRGKPVGFWESRNELHAKCAVALSKAFNTSRRPGWLPATEFGSPEITTELSRLSTENAKLRAEVEEYKKLTDVSAFAQGQEIVTVSFEIRNNWSSPDWSLQNTPIETIAIDTSWNALFLGISETLLVDQSERVITEALGKAFREVVLNKFAQGRNITLEQRADLAIAIKPSDFKQIRAQFMVLRLITLEHFENEHNTRLTVLWNITSNGMYLYASELAKPSSKSTSALSSFQ